MEDIIHLLPDSVANQIAAGEVISRPASVIKELVENAIDATADNIEIIVKDGGKTLIQVIDNGIGMSDTDARLAFERHATSKISDASDLFALHTMGFRGEALPSICAISQVELDTRRKEDTLGTRLIISGSKVVSQELCSCPIGSNFKVKNLFFNTPGRRRFLKKDTVELKHIMREFERLALVNYDKKFSIETENKKIVLPPGTFISRICSIWKNNLDKHLIPVDVETSLVKIKGYISRPEHARKINPLQYLIVNGRNMRHPSFHKAITRSYENLIPNGMQPNYFIMFEVDPATIDVNVHPTKHEIKFEDEASIFQILTASVKSALGQHAAVPSIDFTQDVIPVRPPKSGEFVDIPQMDVDRGYNPFNNTGGGCSNGHRRSFSKPTISQNWGTLYDNFFATVDDNSKSEDGSKLPDMGPGNDENIISDICMQVSNKYIVTASRDGLIIIDQHRAHVRIIYDSLVNSLHSNKISTSQGVLFSDSISLDSRRRDSLEAHADEFKRLGFLLEYDEDDRWNIRGVPSFLEDSSIHAVIEELLDISDEELATSESIYDYLLDRLCYATAKARAYKGGDVLNKLDMERLVSDLFSLDDNVYTPSGLPIYKQITNEALASLFK